MVDFFISRAGEDKVIARTVDTVLREAGFSTFLQDRDFGYADFTAKMDDGFGLVEAGARVIALVSGSYLIKPHCMKEARYPLTDDPENKSQKLIVFRIEDVSPIGFLKAIRYVDLYPYLDDHVALASAITSAVEFVHPIRRSAPSQPLISYPSAADSDFKSARVNKALLLLELEDEEESEKALNYIFWGVLAIAGLLIAFDVGIDFWNWTFGTDYYAIFEIPFVVFFALGFGFLLGYTFFSQVKKVTSSINALSLAPGELRALRQMVKARDWKSKTLINSVVKNVTRNIATKA
ncbi:toll/interleukin-1 receptor domain-containing protein [Hyphomicrobium sp. DY-1]|uniref:toll/interleukin-1 receptor domain-containing protein n=1 Tax=Hyphomicrobium sp. DY-1 TaxID=3075650 RepID=UPI0039C1FC94